MKLVELILSSSGRAALDGDAAGSQGKENSEGRIAQIMKTRYLALGIGAWYVLAPFLWGYPLGFNWWNDVVIGAAVGALAVSYLIDWNRIGGWALMAVGYYSMLSPFLFGYLQQSAAYWNDLVFGVITVGCGAMLAAAGITYGEPAPGAAGT